MPVAGSYPCHLIFLLIRQWIFFFQLLHDNFFPFSGCLIYFQKMLSNGVLQKHHLISLISMVLQIISAKKTILAKLLHLLTGFIGEIRNQISIYIRIRHNSGHSQSASLLAHERSCFAACVHIISTLHFSSFFDRKFTTFTTNLTLLYNTRQNG